MTTCRRVTISVTTALLGVTAVAFAGPSDRLFQQTWQARGGVHFGNYRIGIEMGDASAQYVATVVNEVVITCGCESIVIGPERIEESSDGKGWLVPATEEECQTMTIDFGPQVALAGSTQCGEFSFEFDLEPVILTLDQGLGEFALNIPVIQEQPCPVESSVIVKRDAKEEE